MSFGEALLKTSSKKTISSKGCAMQNTSLPKILLPFKVYLFTLSFFLSFRPRQMKLKLGLQIGERLLIDNDLSQLLWLWLAQSAAAGGGSSHIIFTSCFSGTTTSCQTLLVAFFHQPQPQPSKNCFSLTKLCRNARPKPCGEPSQINMF